MSEHDGLPGIAIVGMAGRFPGAPDVDSLWSNLCAGVESVRPIDETVLRAAGVDTDEPGFVNAVATLDDMEAFDAAFFGMTRREAELTDPQHRILLETVWNTLEHAGYDPAGDAGRIGLFGGVAENYYMRFNLLAHPDVLTRAGFYPVRLAAGREYAIMKAAYKLGLTGPAISVMTACSTSAVATHLAVQSLLAGECDLALAGGAHLFLPGLHGYTYAEDGILSPDGHVRTFDADARGTVMGSGVAFVALKRLDDAVADSDTIYAVIRGSAVNNDGAAKVGFTAPGLEGQRTVIEDALTVADVDADSIGMLEAHGTGTSLGDPIEISALTEAFRRHTARRHYCAIGTLKSNIGHLDVAAGAAGLIKAALALHHGRIPPSINYRSPNPQIDFEDSPFFVNSELLEWPRTDAPRRAGVSSFGFGGTNAHIVLEEAPLPPPSAPAAEAAAWILALSARSSDALERRRQELADHLDTHPGSDLRDVAQTLVLGRSRMPHRSAIVAADTSAAVELLRSAQRQAAAAGPGAATGVEVAFLLTGQGAQSLGMGRGLYETEPVFAAVIDACAEIVGEIDGHDLRDLVFGGSADPEDAAKRIMHTDVGQPAIFALQIALARLWESWGIRPAALVGHSVGEIAAACLGGVLSMADALGLATARGRLMADLPHGAMTAVLADQDAVLPLLDEDISLAAVNAVEQCVASGSPKAIDALEQRLSAVGMAFRRLPTDRAFHSPMMDPVLDPLRDHVASLERGPMTIPMVSTLTGAWLRPDELGEPGYWSRHARQTVRFRDAIGVLLDERPDLVLIEVGPGETLASLARQHPSATADSVIVSTLPHRGAGTDDAAHARRALAAAWAAGVDIDWLVVHGGRGRRIPLPTYPFARERYWIEGMRASLESPAGAATPGPVSTAVPVAASSVPTMPTTASLPAVPAAAAVPDGAPQTPLDRKDRIAAEITAILTDLSGLDADLMDPNVSFTDLGFDSLFLTQANSHLRRQFGIRITLGQVLGETPTVAALAERIDAELGPDQSRIDAPSVASIRLEPTPSDDHGPLHAGRPLLPSTPRPDATNDPLRWDIAEQLRLVPTQLDMIRASIASGDPRITAGMPSSPQPGPGGGDSASTDVPVLPNVVRFMIERESPPTDQWNLGVMLTPTRRVDAEFTRRVVGELIDRFDALRLRFLLDGAVSRSSVAPTGGSIPFGSTDLRHLAPAEQRASIERRASVVQESLDLARGPLIHVELFDLQDEQRLLVVAHHFVMDPLSWPSFWRDFEALYDAAEQDRPMRLPEPITTFTAWARALQRWAETDAVRRDIELWRRLPWDRVRPIPLDHPEGVNTNASAEHVELVLSPEETVTLLRETPGVTRKADLIITSLANAVAEWSGADTALIDMMGHGRDDDMFEGIDPMETVGFFISYTPLVLRIPDPGPGALAPTLSDQIDPLIDRGLGFDLLRHMTRDDRIRQEFRGLPRAQILFNHHGQRDEPSEVPRSRMFTRAAESIGETHDPGSVRYYPIAVLSRIHHGQLRLNFVFSTDLHDRVTIERLAMAFHHRLSEILTQAATASKPVRARSGGLRLPREPQDARPTRDGATRRR